MDASSDQYDYEFGVALDAGRKRSQSPNQDSAEVVQADPMISHPPLLLLADGMGGHRGGEVASRIVVDVFKWQFKQNRHPADYPSLLEECAKKAHIAVRVHGTQDENLAHMGSTVVAVVLEEGKIHLLNDGDSRTYIMRGNKMMQVSQDQSWAAEQVRAGLLAPQAALNHPGRNRLNMAITAQRPEIKPFTAQATVEPEDTLLLCSDGLWSVVPESLVRAVLAEFSPQAAAQRLVSLANQCRGPDNISVIVARRRDR